MGRYSSARCAAKKSSKRVPVNSNSRSVRKISQKSRKKVINRDQGLDQLMSCSEPENNDEADPLQEIQEELENCLAAERKKLAPLAKSLLEE